MSKLQMCLTRGEGRHPDRRAPVELGASARLPEGETLGAMLSCLREAKRDEAFGYFIDTVATVERISWSEMIARAERIARGLLNRGAAPKERIVIALPNSVDLLACFIACQIVGAVPCLVEPAKLGRGLASWIEHLTPKLRVLEPIAVVVEAAATGAVADALAPIGVKVYAADTLPSEGRVTWHAGRDSDLAFVQFSSGTTSSPKAVACSHRALRANLSCLGALGGWREGDLMVGWLPLFHDMGLVATTLGAICHGLPVALMPPIFFLLRPARWLWAIHALRGSISFAPNFAYHLATRRLADNDIEGLDLSSWRLAFNAAEMVHAGTIREFAQRFADYGFSGEAMLPAYGMAEVVVGISIKETNSPLIVDCISRGELSRSGRALPVDRAGSDAMEVVQVGTIFPGHEIRILGEDDALLGDREQGEILIRGPSLFDGYFRNEQATRDAFVDGWLRTGDLGYLHEGRLFVSGRCKEIIVRGGEKYHPYLIERAAGMVEGVRDGCVAAVGVTNEATGTEDLVVLYETLEKSSQRLGEIDQKVLAAVRQATGLSPNRLVAMAPRSIPKTTSGKIRRGLIRQRLATEPVPTAARES